VKRLRKSNKKKAAPKKTVKKKAASVGRRKPYRASARPGISGNNRKLGVSGKRRVMEIDKNISVIGAAYSHGLVLKITFSNGIKKEVDFSKFFENEHPAYLDKYKAPRNFKSFKVDDGNIVWGRDWDLIFPVSVLYDNKVK
jgi:hypothetical protein